MKAHTFITCRKILGQRWEVTEVHTHSVVAVRHRHWEDYRG